MLCPEGSWKIPFEAPQVPGLVLVRRPEKGDEDSESVSRGRSGDLLLSGLSSGAFFFHNRGRLSYSPLEENQVAEGVVGPTFSSEQIHVHSSDPAGPFVRSRDLCGDGAPCALLSGAGGPPDQNGSVGGELRAPVQGGG